MTARKFLALPLAFAGGVILASFAACTGTNDSHCSVKGGDVYCQEKTGQAEGAVFCTNNCGGDYDFDGCLVATEAPADDCWLCEGEGSDNCGSIGDGDSDSTDADTTADTETADATETMDTTTAETGPECTMSGDCSMVGEPLCDGDACVGCGDAATASCAADYPETPVCDAGSGACVECTVGDVSACPAEEPACEGGVCVPCDEHEQCPDSACNMSTGACMDVERVWWVDQSVGDGGDGSEGSPFDQFADVLPLIGNGQEGTIYLATAGPHLGQLVVVNGQTVAVLRKNQTGTLQNNVAAAVLNGGTLFAQDMHISSSLAGISCTTGGELWMSDVVIQSNMGRGVSIDECDAHLSRSLILNNPQAGIRLVAGELQIVNSIVGSDINDVPSIDVVGGTLSVSYSTVVAGLLTSTSIKCGNQGVGSSVRNSLVVARTVGPETSQCGQMTISNSALEMDVMGNVGLGDMDASWFADISMGDYHLGLGAPTDISTAAVWQTGDPETDIDGNARPTTDGTPDYAGADVLN